MAERRSIYKDIDEINRVLYALRHGLSIDEVEQDKRQNRFFEKVSFDEFLKAVRKHTGNKYSDEDITKMYEGFKK